MKQPHCAQSTVSVFSETEHTPVHHVQLSELTIERQVKGDGSLESV